VEHGFGGMVSQSAHVPVDAGFDMDLPAIVEPDLSAGRIDDLDVPDFLK
jgi:cell division protein FtsZ